MEHCCLLASLAVFLPRAIRGKARNTGRQNGRSAVNTACNFPTTVAVFLFFWARVFLLLWARVRSEYRFPGRFCVQEGGVRPKLALSNVRRSFCTARAEARRAFLAHPYVSELAALALPLPRASCVTPSHHLPRRHGLCMVSVLRCAQGARA